MRKFLLGAALLGAVACGEAGEEGMDDDAAMDAPAAAAEAAPMADDSMTTMDSTMGGMDHSADSTASEM